jgi:6-phospho-beta-glucosidase
VRLAILGGGGFRVPLVYQALLTDSGPLRDVEVVLYDSDHGRQAVIEQVLAQQAADAPDPPPITSAASLDAAVDGADFVFSAIRVGGLSGRQRDERVALDLGVLGQETTGPAGIAFGLRTIPVALQIAERVERLSPSAYVLNFTNPAGMITEAMQQVLGERVIGICDTPAELGRRIAATVGLAPDRARFDYVGLNHLGWMRGVYDATGGPNLLPALLADDEALATLEESEMFGADWLRTLGCVPNEYLYYYYFNREAVDAINAQDAPRGAFLTRQQTGFYEAAAQAPHRSLELWRQTTAERHALYMAEARSGAPKHDTRPAEHALGDHALAAEPAADGGYSGVALGVMRAITGPEPATMILNVRNGGALAGLDDDAVVELPAVVDGAGAHPLPAAGPVGWQLGLMQQIKAVERLTIEAAITGSLDAALKALALHPLVDSVTIARRLLEGFTAGGQTR